MPRRKEKILHEEIITEIGGDRRAYQRYTTDLPLEYTAVKNGTWIGAGTGTAIDMSSGGVAFRANEVLQPGVFVELSMEWPVAGNGRPMELVISGRVVRSDAQSTAIRKEHYEFRVQEKSMWAAMPMAAGFC